MGGVGVKADLYALVHAAGIGVYLMEHIAALAVVPGHHGGSAVREAQYAVHIALVHDAVGIAAVGGNGPDAAAGADEDIVVLVKTHSVGVQPLVLGHIDGRTAELIAIGVKPAYVILLLVLLGCPVFIAVLCHIGIAIVPGAVNHLNGDKAIIGKAET